MTIRCETTYDEIVLGADNNYVEISFEDREAVAVEMWYDRSRRHWVVYPVDADGNQLKEAEYGFGKAEAMRIKKDLELELGI